MSRVFGYFRDFMGILLFYRFWRYFAHLIDFDDILLILESLWIILDVQGYIDNFRRLGLFMSF